MNRPLISTVVIALLAACSFASAQGLLIVEDPAIQVRLPRSIVIWPPHPRPIPRPLPPPISYRIKELSVEARLVDQVAHVQMSQTFTNTGSQSMEVAFVFPLPYDGAIDRMTLLIDGREHPAKLLDAKEARRMYEEIVRRNRDPGLLEWVGTGMFRTSVFPVPVGASRTIMLRYSQLCRAQEGLTDFVIPLSTAKYTSEPVEKVQIRAMIESREDIKNVYSPTHAVEIERPDARHAAVQFRSTKESPTTDFRLFYDVGRGKLSARVLSYRPDRNDEGYFLLLASPEIKAAAKKPSGKTVLLVIDRSGSMSGTKIEQVRAALTSVLNSLRPGDLFNVIAYDTDVEAFRPELQRFDDETRKAAIGFVDGIYAGGGTNIDGAMQAALRQLQDEKQPNYVIFLTDGVPTVGETNEVKIVAHAKEWNKVRARIFAFGVGYDVNSRLIDKLVRESFGQSLYVRPNEDIEARVGQLSSRIESPVLTGVQLNFEFDEKGGDVRPVSRVYPKGAFDVFAGEQLVIVGRYRKSGAAKVIVEGAVGGDRQKFDFPATFAEKSDDESLAFVAKLWAVRRVGEILDELDLRGKNEELVRELIDLATRHGILTPYTSFMADERTDVRDVSANARRAGGRLVELQQTHGAGAFAQRSFKGAYQNAASGPAAAVPLESFAAGREVAKDLSFGDDAAREAKLVVQNVRNVANRTFFRRDGQWVDSQVTKDQERTVRRIKQFSDEYFDLARTQGQRLSPYLAFDEPLLLNVDGQAYLIEP